MSPQMDELLKLLIDAYQASKRDCGRLCQPVRSRQNRRKPLQLLTYAITGFSRLSDMFEEVSELSDQT